MKVEINLDPACGEPKVVVHTDRITPEINALVETLAAAPKSSLLGYREAEVVILALDEIVRIYALEQRVFAQYNGVDYALRQRLYEVEQLCQGSPLVRISNAEIVNFKKVKSLDFSMAGTIMLNLDSGQHTFVSRRYLPKIRNYLGLK